MYTKINSIPHMYIRMHMAIHYFYSTGNKKLGDTFVSRMIIISMFGTLQWHYYTQVKLMVRLEVVRIYMYTCQIAKEYSCDKFVFLPFKVFLVEDKLLV